MFRQDKSFPVATNHTPKDVLVCAQWRTAQPKEGLLNCSGAFDRLLYPHLVRSMAKETPDDAGRFGPTRWSLITRLQDLDPERQREALGTLLTDYYPALLAHLVVREHVDVHRAEDILQGFVSDKILANNLLSKVDRAKGRFRSFLLRSLKNYLLDQVKHDQAQKRAADHADHLGDFDVEQVDREPNSDVFDAAWARTVLERAIRRLRDESLEKDQRPIWAVFESRLLRPMVDGGEPTTYEDLVEQLGFATPKQAASALITAKRRFNRILRSIVLEYVDDADVDQEIANLRATLATAGGLAADFEALADRSPLGGSTSDGDSLNDIDMARLTALEAMFRFTSQRDVQWETDELAAMWQHLLAQPIEGVGPDHPLDGKTAEDLLGSPAPPLDVLEALKLEYGNYARSLKSPLPTKISTVFYFATIAAALVRHRKRISSSPDAVLREGFDICLAETFLDPTTRSLVGEAAASLRMNH